MTEATIKELIKKRGHIKARLTKFSGYIRELADKSLCAAQVTELQLRIDKLEYVYNTYDEIQTKLEYMMEDDEAQLDERSDFEDLYYSSVAAAKELVTIHTKVASSDGGPENNTRRHPHVKCKLPTISLPKFGGSYDTWLEFRDTFDSLINNDDSIDDVNKFHYLRASLEGSAALILQSLALSSSNYKIAWQLLCDRYNNKRLLVNNHIRSIFNLTPITKESPTAIRHLIDTLCKNIRALATLNEPTTHWDTLLVYIICQKLDNVTRREWEEFVPSCETITFGSIINFLSDRADLLETIAMDGPGRRASWPLAPGAGAASAAHGRAAAQRVKENCFVALDERENNTVSSPPFTYECPLCKRGHWLFECPDFLALSNKERADKVQGMKVCLNCLKPNHIAKYCRRSPCNSCSLRHNSLIHFDKLSSKDPVAMPTIEVTPSTPSEHDGSAPDPGCSADSSIMLPAHAVLQGQVLLSTALVEVYDRDGKTHVARAFLDPGAACNLIRSDFLKKLNLPIRQVNASLTGIKNMKSSVHKLCDAKFTSVLDKSFNMERSFYVLPQVTCDLPLHEVNVPILDIPKHLVLADPKFNVPAAIDILFSAEVFWELLGSERLKLGRNKPWVYETKLGWVVSGPNVYNPNSKSMPCHFVQLNNSDDELTRFWKLDEATIKPASAYHTNDERACEEHFVQDTSRLPSGRFIVRYPLKQSSSSLGNSYERGKQCFLSLERQTQLKSMSTESMNEYESLGDMSKVTCNETVGNLLPHHDVLRLSSVTTKLRVGFKASSRTSTEVTLTDIQHAGPTTQDDLIAILLVLLQLLWLSLVFWDDEVPQDISKKWQHLTRSLPELNKLSIPRCVVGIHAPRVEFHIFTDASLTAYGAVLYVRTITSVKLSTNELQTIMDTLVKFAQKELLYRYDDIKNKTALKTKDPLTKLNPFLDSDGLMCVGGRLQNAPFNFEKKHLPILPKQHIITVTYFNFVHIVGPQVMEAYINSTYRPIGGRALAKSTYHKCVICTRMRGATIKPLMGNLSSQRGSLGFPFEVVGVDYASPILAASRKGRGSQTIKVYIVIFLYFKPKYLRLELCSDLPAVGYMAFLKRFIRRRSLPSDIYPDNRTQFAEPYNGLIVYLTSHAKTLSESAANDGIRFHFVPPYSPHFGGLWEVEVRSTKHCLVRVLGNCHLTFVEIYSTLCHIEAILNPPDQLPLSPGNFLIGRTLKAPLTPCLTQTPPSRLTRYKRIEQLRQHYYKWRQAKGQRTTDTMVVIKDDNLPPLKWKLSRIVSVIPEPDGISHVADIRTSTAGIIRRAFIKICPLPIEK